MEADGYETKQFESTCACGLLEAAALKLRLAVEVVGATEGAWDGDDEEGEWGEWEALGAPFRASLGRAPLELHRV